MLAAGIRDCPFQRRAEMRRRPSEQARRRRRRNRGRHDVAEVLRLHVRVCVNLAGECGVSIELAQQFWTTSGCRNCSHPSHARRGLHGGGAGTVHQPAVRVPADLRTGADAGAAPFVKAVKLPHAGIYYQTRAEAIRDALEEADHAARGLSRNSRIRELSAHRPFHGSDGSGRGRIGPSRDRAVRCCREIADGRLIPVLGD